MININNIPLVTDESNDYKNFFSEEYENEYLIKPIFKYLPDFDGMGANEKRNYKFKHLKEGRYLVGMEIISDKWVNKGFCANLFRFFGLILDESYPVVMNKNEYSTEKSMVFLRFEHILFDISNKKYDNEMYLTKE